MLWVADQESCTSTENGQSLENVASYDGQQSTPDGTLVFSDTPLSKACGESGGSGPLLARPTAGGSHRLPAQGPGEASPGRPPPGRPPNGRPLDGRPPPGRPPLVALTDLPWWTWQTSSWRTSPWWTWWTSATI